MKNSPKKKSNIRFAFFGTSRIAVYVLEELKRAKLLPALIVTPPDKPQGRGKKLVPSPVMAWALKHKIDVLQPEKLSSDVLENIRTSEVDVVVLVDYGKIIPNELLAIPRRGFLNVHPSLLPRLRGPSPVRSAILNDEKNFGVSIIELDGEVDHGPIVAQKKVVVPNLPVKNSELERILLTEGGKLLAQILPYWIVGKLDARPQNHDVATYCEKIKKEDGLLDLNGDPYRNQLKIRAFEGWPGTYAFFERNGKQIRVNILDAHVANETLVIDRVKPAGKREMNYEEFLRSGAKPL